MPRRHDRQTDGMGWDASNCRSPHTYIGTTTTSVYGYLYIATTAAQKPDLSRCLCSRPPYLRTLPKLLLTAPHVRWCAMPERVTCASTLADWAEHWGTPTNHYDHQSTPQPPQQSLFLGQQQHPSSSSSSRAVGSQRLRHQFVSASFTHNQTASPRRLGDHPASCTSSLFGW